MKKKKFWLIIFVLVVFLVILLLARPDDIDTNILLVRNSAGETAEIVIRDLLGYDGILFKEISLKDENPDNPLLNWFIKYRSDKGDNLLRVFYINDIIQMTGFENKEYTLLRFDSADGASVLLQLQEDRDNLILLTIEREKDELSVRLILPLDNFSQRWLKNVVRITY